MSVSSASPRPPMREGAILFLVAAVHFINILDFMMVMPLGPDFSAALGIPPNRLGLIGGSYTVAAAVAGVVSSLFLDRFDRRKALGVSMFGLVLATAAGALATGLPSLIATRVLAGFFGGPATAVSLAIIADVVPPERRGRAIGLVMLSFSVASVFGVPAGLELASLGSWRTPFLAVAGLGVVVCFAALAFMPPLRGHLDRPRTVASGGARSIVTEPVVLLSLVSTALLTLAMFSVIPNISSFVQFNLHYPREGLGGLYLAGGIASILTMPVVGRLVDRIGATAVSAIGALVFGVVLYAGFVRDPVLMPVMALFVGFMISGALRNVAFQSLTSRVPGPTVRATFMSMQSAVQHLASAGGAFLSVQLLETRADQTLAGMPVVATVSIVLSVAVLVPIWLVEAGVRRREASARAEPGVERLAA